MSGEKRELIQDFSGGLNSLVSPNRLSPSESPSVSNVWNETMALAGRRGEATNTFNLSTGAPTVAPGGGVGCYLQDQDISGTEYLFGVFTLSGGTDCFPAYSTSPAVFTIPVLGGDSGTASLTSGNATVTVSTTNVSVGDAFFYTLENTKMFTITTVGATTITLDSAPVNTTTAAYAIVPRYVGAPARIGFANLNKSVYIFSRDRANGAPAVAFQPGVSGHLTQISSFPLAFYGVVYNNYLVVANTSANPTRVMWSALKDGTTWPASNFVDCGVDDGQPIVGIFNDGQSVVIVKSRSAYKLTGSILDPANPTFTLTQISVPGDFLCRTTRSVQMFNGRYLILGDYGLYEYSPGNSYFSYYQNSQKIRSDLESFVANGWNGGAAFTEPSGVVWRNKYWLSKGSTILILDENEKWWKFSSTANNWQGLCLSGIVGGVGGSLSITAVPGYGSSSTSQIYQLDTGTSDNNTAISPSWTSKVFDFPEQQVFTRAYVHYKKQSTGTLVFSYRVNDTGTFSTFNVDMTTGTGGGQRLKSPPITIGSIGTTIQFKLSDATLNDSIEVYAIEFFHRPLRQ